MNLEVSYLYRDLDNYIEAISTYEVVKQSFTYGDTQIHKSPRANKSSSVIRLGVFIANESNCGLDQKWLSKSECSDTQSGDHS